MLSLSTAINCNISLSYFTMALKNKKLTAEFHDVVDYDVGDVVTKSHLDAYNSLRGSESALKMIGVPKVGDKVINIHCVTDKENVFFFMF